MLSSAGNRTIAGLICAAASAATMLLSAGTASALPPNCTAADLNTLSADVSTATAAYLFSHPDVNNFYTGIHGMPKAEGQAKIKDYLDANPQVKADLQAIRSPLADFRTRCHEPN